MPAWRSSSPPYWRSSQGASLGATGASSNMRGSSRADSDAGMRSQPRTAGSTASSSTWKGRPGAEGRARPTNTVVPAGRRPVSSRTSRLLPTPASPLTMATWGSPRAAKSPTVRSSSADRPTMTGESPSRPVTTYVRVPAVPGKSAGRPRSRPPIEAGTRRRPPGRPRRGRRPGGGRPPEGQPRAWPRRPPRPPLPPSPATAGATGGGPGGSPLAARIRSGTATGDPGDGLRPPSRWPRWCTGKRSWAAACAFLPLLASGG